MQQSFQCTANLFLSSHINEMHAIQFIFVPLGNDNFQVKELFVTLLLYLASYDDKFPPVLVFRWLLLFTLALFQTVVKCLHCPHLMASYERFRCKYCSRIIVTVSVLP